MSKAQNTKLGHGIYLTKLLAEFVMFHCIIITHTTIDFKHN